jgi:gentisate 1,2-dioxygenase
MFPKNFIKINKESNSLFETALEKNVKIYEYVKAANPNLSKIPIKTFRSIDFEKNPTSIIPFDLSLDLKTKYKATSPNLLASFIKIVANDEIELEYDSISSQLLYIIEGYGKCNIYNDGILNYYQGDMLVLSNARVTFRAAVNTMIYWINDEPLMKYLNVKSINKNFYHLLIRSDYMLSCINNIINEGNNENKNRLGILLGNPATDPSETGTLTVTPILWSLLNIIQPNTIQKPHKHNSIALDLCVCAPNKGIYTLMGPELDINGNVKDPIRCEWESGSVFVTPPGWWHSHHNETEEPGWVLPIQDAGLHTYMRTLDIQFT